MELVGLIGVALVAGVVSISSPCVLPLLPGYVAYVSRSTSRDDEGGGRRDRIGPVLFVAGFTTVFVVTGLAASAIGLALRQHADVLTRGGGLVVITMGMAMTGLIRIPWLDREVRPGLRREGAGRLGAFSLGAAFAFGWTPCVGPVLATVLGIAATSGRLVTGVVLLAAYALGLGVPFLLLARAVARGHDRLRWVRRHSRHIEIAGGVVLAVTGVLMVTGVWSSLMAGLLASYARLGWPPI